MKNILLVGLTDQEAAAVEIMIGMAWRNQGCIAIGRSLSLAMPEQTPAAQACHCCVVDLFGLGMRRYSEDAEARLMEFLAGRSAVLLAWGSGGGWLDQRLSLAPGQHVEWLTMPYSSADLRDVLRRVKDAAEETVAPALGPPAAAARPTNFPTQADQAALPAKPVESQAKRAPAWQRAMELAQRLSKPDGKAPLPVRAMEMEVATAGEARARAPQRVSLPQSDDSATSVVQPHAAAVPLAAPRAHAAAAPKATPARARGPLVDGVGLRQGGMALLLHAFPQLRDVPMVRLAKKVLEGQSPKMLQIGPDTAFVMDVTDGWLASGLSTSALIKLLHTGHLVEGVKVLPLPLDQVEQAVRQRFGGRFHLAQKPLDVITWELIAESIKDLSLAVHDDLSFQLRRFPDFTRLANVDPLHIQLAAICARMPQSIAELTRAFPKHEQSVLRFVVQSIASGLASTMPMAGGGVLLAPVATLKPATNPPPQAAKRGFLKSLLNKLF